MHTHTHTFTGWLAESESERDNEKKEKGKCCLVRVAQSASGGSVSGRCNAGGRASERTNEKRAGHLEAAHASLLARRQMSLSHATVAAAHFLLLLLLAKLAAGGKADYCYCQHLSVCCSSSCCRKNKALELLLKEYSNNNNNIGCSSICSRLFDRLTQLFIS